MGLIASRMPRCDGGAAGGQAPVEGVKVPVRVRHPSAAWWAGQGVGSQTRATSCARARTWAPKHHQPMMINQSINRWPCPAAAAAGGLIEVAGVTMPHLTVWAVAVAGRAAATASASRAALRCVSASGARMGKTARDR